ncbi:MAG: hypothetical protein E7536_01935 [Ruminococcaceae bacterium]|nr:hypothetical protein [Oscillospiraceae bacterium]
MKTLIQKLQKGKLFDNRFIFLSMFGSLLLTLLIAYCYNMIPFENFTILRMDLYHQYGPLFAELYERIKGGESLLYSWNAGGGSSFLGNFYNYLSSPLSLIILLFSHENIPVAIGVMIFAKAVFASATFTYYLKKSLKRHSYITAGFGVLYAFSGYFIAYYWNLMWLDAFVMLPLVLLGIERIINRGKPMMFILSLAATMFSNYYMAYMVCLFSVFYFLYYYFAHYSISDSLADIRFPYEKDKPSNKGYFYKIRSSRFLGSGVTFAFGAITAALCVAFALLPTYFILKACSATSGTFPEELQMYNSVFDILANHLASVEPTIRSSGVDVLPNVYCSIMTVMLVPLFYFTKTISLREKISTTVLLGVLYVSFNTNYLNYIWHGFHFPNDLPYRFSFMYTFVILVIAFKTLMRIKEFSPKELLGIGFGTVLFVIMVEEIGSKNVDDDSVLISLAFAIIYSVGFYLLSNKKFNRQATSLFILCCLISEYAIASTDNYVMNQELKYYSTDYSDFVEIKETIDEEHGNDNIYRMELTNLRTRMDPCWYDYNGVSIFSSMAYEKLSNLQQNLGMYGNYINSYTYNMQTPVYNAMFSLEYIVNNSSEVIMNEDLFDYIDKNKTFTAYENKYSLPIAYMVDDMMKEWDYAHYNPFVVQEDYFECATGIDDVFIEEPIFDITGYGVSDLTNPSDGSNCFWFTADATDGTGEITILIMPEETKNLYLYVDTSDLGTLTVEYQGRQKTQDASDEHYILDLGVCEKNEVVTLKFTVNEGVTSGYCDFMLRSVDMDKFLEGYEILKNQSLSVKEFTDTKISGTITAPEDGVLYTSIPYDEGWQITVDGAVVETEEMFPIGEALLGIHLEKGKHEIDFKYTPQGLKIGICMSIAGLIILLLYFFVVRKIKPVRIFTLRFDPSQDMGLTRKILDEIDRQNAEIMLQQANEALEAQPDNKSNDTTETE